MPDFILYPCVNFPDKPRQIDAGGTHALTSPAVDTVPYKIFCLVTAMKKIGHDQPDSPDVDVAHLMTAHHPVHRADIGTGPAPHTTEHLGKRRIPGELAPAVVQKHNMHLFAVINGGPAFIGSGNPGDIGGNGLARGISGQHPNNPQRVMQGRCQLLETHQSHMHTGQCGHQPGIALIGDNTKGTGVGKGKVCPGNAHVRLYEFLPKFPPGHLDQVIYILGFYLVSGEIGKKIPHLVPRQMDGRHHHMAGPLMP